MVKKSTTKKPGTEVINTGGWPSKIITLRTAVGLNRAAFSRRLNLSDVMVYYWETGQRNKEPSSESYVKLANFAAESGQDPLWFLLQAGVTQRTIETTVPNFKSLLRERPSAPVGDAVHLPVLRDIGYVGMPSLAPPSDVEMLLPIPSAFVPNAEKTTCLRVPREDVVGDSTSTEFVAVDSSETDADLLHGSKVVAFNTGSGKAFRSGIYVRHLYVVGEQTRVAVLTRAEMPDLQVALQMDMYIPNEAGTAYTGISPMLSAWRDAVIPIRVGTKEDPSWRILGRVVCTVTAAAPLGSVHKGEKGRRLRKRSTARRGKK